MKTGMMVYIITQITLMFFPVGKSFDIDFSKVESSGFLDIGARKVIFGGWDFSTDSSTYKILEK